MHAWSAKESPVTQALVDHLGYLHFLAWNDSLLESQAGRRFGEKELPSRVKDPQPDKRKGTVEIEGDDGHARNFALGPGSGQGIPPLNIRLLITTTQVNLRTDSEVSLLTRIICEYLP